MIPYYLIQSFYSNFSNYTQNMQLEREREREKSLSLGPYQGTRTASGWHLVSFILEWSHHCYFLYENDICRIDILQNVHILDLSDSYFIKRQKLNILAEILYRWCCTCLIPSLQETRQFDPLQVMLTLITWIRVWTARSLHYENISFFLQFINNWQGDILRPCKYPLHLQSFTQWF